MQEKKRCALLTVSSNYFGQKYYGLGREHEASSFDILVYSLQFFTYEDAFETETNFSAIYKPDFMMKVLDLQQRIEALKTEGDFKYERGRSNFASHLC